MKLALFACLGAALVCTALWLRGALWGFTAQRPEDYADGAPTFDLRTAFQGSVNVSGLIHDFTGRTRVRFTAVMRGAFTETGGVIDEVFDYGNGETATRQWRVTFHADDRFTATAHDIVGTAHGRQLGNAIELRYRLRLPEGAGGHVLDVVDWMYLSQDGVIINKSEMRKFGLKVAELIAALVPSNDEAPS